jgi:hypothetical protein
MNIDIEYIIQSNNKISKRHLYFLKKYEEIMCEYNTENTIKYYICIALDKKNNKIAGIGKASIYSSDTCVRCSQWNFVKNHYRNLWIDLLYVRKKYRHNLIGRTILNKLEITLCKYYYKHKNNILKNKIYIFSSNGNELFYTQCNYKQINTEYVNENNIDSMYPLEIDNRDPNIFMNEKGKWFSKSIRNIKI